MVDRWFWEEHLQKRAGIAPWDVSAEKVWNHEAIDIDTKNQDIFRRDQFFEAHEYPWT